MKTILLVEDNPDDEELTRIALQESHIAGNLVVAHDGREAIDLLLGSSPAAQRASAFPQLVLLDLQLPKVSGLEVLRRLRQDPRTKLLPVVVLTSSDEEPDIVRSYGLGANSYVRKPTDFGQFVEAVRQLSLYWLTINQPAPLVA